MMKVKNRQINQNPHRNSISKNPFFKKKALRNEVLIFRVSACITLQAKSLCE